MFFNCLSLPPQMSFLRYNVVSPFSPSSLSIFVKCNTAILFFITLILVLFKTAIAQNHISSAVGDNFKNNSSFNTSLYKEIGGYRTPPAPVKKLQSDGSISLTCLFHFEYF